MLGFKDYEERDKFDKKYYKFRTRIIDFYIISDCIDYFYSIWYISKKITKTILYVVYLRKQQDIIHQIYLKLLVYKKKLIF